jgi:sortase A
VLAGLALWLMLFGFVLSGLVEAHAQHDLYNQFRLELAQGVAPTGGAISEGEPVAVINSPAAHLHDVVVVEGTSSRALRSGPGHHPGDPLPGQAGVVVLMGRSASYGAPFAHITALHAGDIVDLVTGQGLFHYKVEDVRRSGDEFPPPLAVNGSQLTLITSEGSGWQTGWAPGQAVFVDAVLNGTAAPTPAGHGVASEADGVLHGDTRGLYPLVLWLQLLVIPVVGGIWARGRWGRPQTWLVAGPIALAGLWGASTNVWLLLPNLF